MRIILFDYETNGHHITYLNLFSEELVKLGYKTLVCTPSNDHSLFSLKGNKNVKYYTIKDIPKKPSKFNFFSTRNYIINLWRQTAKELELIEACSKNDLVFFPSIDEYMTAYIPIKKIDKIFNYNWAGLFLKPRYIRIKQKYSFLRKGIFNINYLLNSSNCKSFGILDEGIVNIIQNKYPQKKIYFLPDLISNVEPNINQIQIEEINIRASNRKIILLIGAIDKRKGLINLLEAINKIDESKYYFVIAGEIYIDSFNELEKITLKNLDKVKDNIYLYNKKIENESNFNAFISQCDILYAAYIDFPFSSNMIGKSVYFKKPIIVSKGYLMEEMVNEYNLGIAIDPNKKFDIVSAIERLSNSPYQANLIMYNKKYTRDFFRENIRNIIQQYYL